MRESRRRIALILLLRMSAIGCGFNQSTQGRLINQVLLESADEFPPPWPSDTRRTMASKVRVPDPGRNLAVIVNESTFHLPKILCSPSGPIADTRRRSAATTTDSRRPFPPDDPSIVREMALSVPAIVQNRARKATPRAHSPPADLRLQH